MAETVHLGTGKIELTVGRPTGMASQTWANAQLSTKQASIAGFSQSGANNAFTGSIDTPTLRVNFPGGNARLHVLGDTASANEVLMRVENGYGQGDALTIHKANNVGYIGIRNYWPSEALHVVGNILCSGSITGASKSFSIVHPDPAKSAEGYHLRHWCVETADAPGGLVMYRRTIDMTSTTATFEMPDWFSHLVKDVMVQATPYQHFGSAWGGCVENTIEIHATTIGKWHVLITAARADHCATFVCEQQVEYIPEVPEREEPFPN